MKRRGFTLVELLVTTALVSLVGATVVAAVTGCLRVWGKVNSHGETTSWTETAFAGIRRDLRNVKKFTPVVFDGEYDTMTFASLVNMPLSTGEDIAEIGKVGYYFDNRHKRLCRTQAPYRLLRRARLKDKCDAVMTDVKRVRFSYFTPKTETSEGGWAASWEDPEPPVAVKVEVNYDERAVGKTGGEVLLVHVPLAAHR